MNKTSRNIIIISLALVAAMIASAVMLKFTSNGSWLAFIGWAIFYFSLQVPYLLYTQKSQESCTAWFSRLIKKDAR